MAHASSPAWRRTPVNLPLPAQISRQKGLEGERSRPWPWKRQVEVVEDEGGKLDGEVGGAEDSNLEAGFIEDEGGELEVGVDKDEDGKPEAEELGAGGAEGPEEEGSE